MQKPLKGKRARKSLFESIRFARAHDRGKGSNPYNLNRGLSEAPFKESLVKGLGKRLKAGIGQVNVLDKGTGTGRMLSEVKAFGPKRINATALTLSTTVSQKTGLFWTKSCRKAGLLQSMTKSMI